MKKLKEAQLLAMTIIIILVILATAILLTQLNDNEKSETIIEGLDTPWGIDFLPDGRMIFTEREGKVSLNDGNKTREVGRIPADETGEGGLLGITVDPEFEQNKYIYLYYTTEQGNRISRFVLDETLKDETVLIDNIPSASNHNGGRLKFGPDGKLYATTGDSQEPSQSADTNSLAGKILQLNKDGTIPDDNPFGNYIYSYGHRNPQGLAWDENGILYSSEHGPSKNDEINIIEPGKNYGWPDTCTKQASDTVQPIRCYTKMSLAPGAIAISGKNLYLSGLRGEQIRKITLADDGSTITDEEIIVSGIGRIRDVVIHDGYLYFTTSNRDGRGIPRSGDDKIMRMKFQ